MSTLVLKGYFLKVNKYGRLKFRFIGGSDDTPGKLIDATGENLGPIYSEYAKKRILDIINEDDSIDSIDSIDSDNINKTNTNVVTIGDPVDDVISAPHLPFDAHTFIVVMPKWIKKPPQDILSRVGLICVIEVKAIKYEFSSTAKHNAGEHITGFQLVFSKVVKEIR